MAAPRASTQKTDTQLKLETSLLGNNDSSVLKMTIGFHVEQKLDDIASRKQLNQYQLAKLRSMLEIQTVFEGSIVSQDGSVMQIIRSNIERSIKEGSIKSKEEGKEQLAMYKRLIDSDLAWLCSQRLDESTIAQYLEVDMTARVGDLGRIMRTQAIISAQPEAKTLFHPSTLPALKKYDPEIESKTIALQAKVTDLTKKLADKFAEPLLSKLGDVEIKETSNPPELQLSKLLHSTMGLLNYESDKKEPNPYKIAMVADLFKQLNNVCDDPDLDIAKKKDKIITTLKDIYQGTYQDTVEHAAIAQIGKKRAENSIFLQNIEAVMKANGVSVAEVAQLKTPIVKVAVEKPALPKPAATTQKAEEKKSMLGSLATLFKPSQAEDKKSMKKAAATAEEKKELDSKGPSPIVRGDTFDGQFRYKLSETLYSWEIVKNLFNTKQLINGKITLRQLYQLTNNIRDALQDSNQIGAVVEAIQHFNAQFKQYADNPTAQGVCLTKFIARTQALANKVDQASIERNVKLSEPLTSQFYKDLIVEDKDKLALPPTTKLYVTSETRGAVGQRIMPMLDGCLKKILSQLQHDPTITGGPDAKQKTTAALAALKVRFTETSHLLKEICPPLMDLHERYQKSPEDKAVIEKIHGAIVKLQLDPPRRHQDAFDSRKTYETMRNTIQAERTKASPTLQAELDKMVVKYDAQFKFKPQESQPIPHNIEAKTASSPRPAPK